MKRSKCSVSYAVLLVCAASLFFISCPFFGFDPPDDNTPEDSTPSSEDAFFKEMVQPNNSPMVITDTGSYDSISLTGNSVGFMNSARSPEPYELDNDISLSVTINWDAYENTLDDGERLSVFFSESEGGTGVDPAFADGVMFELKPAGIYAMEMTPGDLGGPNWNTPPQVWVSGGETNYDGKDLILKVSHSGSNWQASVYLGETSLGVIDLPLSDASLFSSGVYVYVGLDIGMALTNPLIVKQINGADLR